MPFTAIDASAAVAISGGPFGSPLTGESDRSTLAELQTWLAKRLGSRDDVETSELTDWINSAIRELAYTLNLDELKDSLEFDTEAGESVYEVPVGMGGIIRASGRIQSEPEWGGPLEVWQIERYRNSAATEGSILSVTRWKNLLLVYPEPTQAETIVLDFRVQVQPLTADSHQTPLHPKWERAIKLLAHSIALGDLGEAELSGVRYNEYLRVVREMESTASENRKATIMAVSLPRNARDLYRNAGRS